MTVTKGATGARSAPLAFVGVDGHIYIQRAGERSPTCLTWSAKSLSYGVWQTDVTSDRLRYFWPTWSPRGDKLACLGTFGQAGQEQGTGIYVFETQRGIESWEMWTGISSSPIYLSWAPDGAHLAFVLQQQEVLSLMLAHLERPGEALALVNGVPLFHRFSPDSQALVVHLGGRFNGEPGRRLYWVDLDTPDRRLTLSEQPGFFGTPAWSPDGRWLAFTLQEAGEQVVCLAEHGLEPAVHLGRFPGVGALFWPDDGGSILVAVAPGSRRSVYEQLWRYPLEAGERELLLEEPFIACFTASRGRLVYLAPGPEEKALTWKVLEPSRPPLTLGTFFPSQPQLFMLHFFHQYNTSHRLLSPDGDRLVCCGYFSRSQMEDDHTLPQVFSSGLEEGDRLEPLYEGSIACWSPVEG